MNIQKLKYKFHSGKNSKPWYYIKGYFLGCPVRCTNFSSLS